VIHGGPTGIDMPFLLADRYYPVERLWREARSSCAPTIAVPQVTARLSLADVRNLGGGRLAV